MTIAVKQLWFFERSVNLHKRACGMPCYATHRPRSLICWWHYQACFSTDATCQQSTFDALWRDAGWINCSTRYITVCVFEWAGSSFGSRCWFWCLWQCEWTSSPVTQLQLSCVDWFWKSLKLKLSFKNCKDSAAFMPHSTPPFDTLLKTQPFLRIHNSSPWDQHAKTQWPFDLSSLCSDCQACMTITVTWSIHFQWWLAFVYNLEIAPKTSLVYTAFLDVFCMIQPTGNVIIITMLVNKVGFTLSDVDHNQCVMHSRSQTRLCSSTHDMLCLGWNPSVQDAWHDQATRLQ